MKDWVDMLIPSVYNATHVKLIVKQEVNNMLIKYHIKNFVKKFPEYKNPPLMQALSDENYMLATYNVVNQLLDNGVFFHVLSNEMIIVEVD